MISYIWKATAAVTTENRLLNDAKTIRPPRTIQGVLLIAVKIHVASASTCRVVEFVPGTWYGRAEKLYLVQQYW